MWSKKHCLVLLTKKKILKINGSFHHSCTFNVHSGCSHQKMFVAKNAKPLSVCVCVCVKCAHQIMMTPADMIVQWVVVEKVRKISVRLTWWMALILVIKRGPALQWTLTLSPHHPSPQVRTQIESNWFVTDVSLCKYVTFNPPILFSNCF